MKRQTCPRCQQHSLFQTWAFFWACGVCCYAMTQAALLIDQADAQVRNERGPSDGQTGDNTALQRPHETILPHPGKLDGAIGVLISLAVSLGMVILTVAS
jgi:hypothetical protein